jgi:signal transduction histidine kinase
MPLARPAWVRYGVVVVSCAGTAAVRHLFLPLAPAGALLAAPLYPAVIVSGWLGGAPTGLLSTALCTLVLLGDAPTVRAATSLELGLFVVNGLLIAGFCDRLRRTRDLWAAAACQTQEAQAEAARRSEEALAANRAKDDFLAVLSHELRTPLTAIVGWTQMLRGGRVTPDMNGRALEIVERNAKIASQLLADMLDVSRIVAGKLTMEKRTIDLRGVVESAIDSLRWAAEEKGVILCPLPAGLPAHVDGDPERLQQAVGNLLGNAIKFTPSSASSCLMSSIATGRATTP